jgi:lysophospholipase L1-like esterase
MVPRSRIELLSTDPQTVVLTVELSREIFGKLILPHPPKRQYTKAMISLILPAILLPQPIRVACVGDSLTFGYALPEATRERSNYPGQLGKRLGGGFVVKGFGHTGCTLMNLDWLPPLIKTPEYKASLAFKPDVVILMGGTNDGNPRNWSHVGQLERDLKQIAHSYLLLPNRPKVILLTPPRICTKAEKGVLEDDQCNNVNQGLPPLLRSFARNNALRLIDSRLSITTRDCYTMDGIHLSEKGCMKLANQIAFVLLKKQTAKK